jgi:hypothetical protein
MGSVDDAEVAFGAGLAGLIVVHVSGVGEFVATGAGAEVAGVAGGGFAGFDEVAFVGVGFPLAEGGPLKLGGVALPGDGGNLQIPASAVSSQRK